MPAADSTTDRFRCIAYRDDAADAHFASPRLDAELLLEHVTGLTRTQFRAAPERELPTRSRLVVSATRQAPHERRADCVHSRTSGILVVAVRSVAGGADSATGDRAPRRTRADASRDGRAGADCRSRHRQRRDRAGDRKRTPSIACRRDRCNRRMHWPSQPATPRACRSAMCSFVQSDWFSRFAGQRFDLIVSNPPYIAIGRSRSGRRRASLRTRSQRCSPARRGLEALTAIARHARAAPATGGWLMLEHGWKQAPYVRDLLVRIRVRSRTLARRSGRSRACHRRASTRPVSGTLNGRKQLAVQAPAIYRV